MKWASRSGFTIIETVLFLGVTGLMIAAMFIGIGSSIGAQRYRDSVESLKSLLQQQYSDVANVYNDNQTRRTCTVSGGNIVVADSATGLERGKAACEIMGRYLTIASNGKVRSNAVLGVKTATAPSTVTNDVARLRASYTLGVFESDVSTNQLEWGVKPAWPKKSKNEKISGNRSIAVMIVRSPDSGGIYTFTGDVIYDTPNSSRLSQLLVSGTAVDPAQNQRGQSKRLICVNPDGLVFTPTRGIYIESAAADSSAVRVSVDRDFTGDESC